ncbi:MAG: hypothetical protein IJA14_03830, partial [Alphaproteobacteria bacterium]|nr:hypothetical protein [Alphaproteobacteria bacterium]
MEDESLDFAHFCQKKYGAMTEFGYLYGISESGYLKTDDHGNLQYLAFGVPYLSIQDHTESFKVFSPYSVFLMLERIGKDVFKVLETLKEVGALGAMGYYEAIEFNSNFIDDYKVVHSYMAHHKGMSFLALANALNNNKNRERFLSRSGFSEKLELVAERFPIEGKIYRKKVSLKPEIQNKITSKIKNLSIKSKTKNSSMITDGKVTFISQQNGRNRLLYNSTDVFHPQSGGLKIKIIDGNENCIFDSTVTNSFQFHNGSTFAEHMETANGLVISLKFSPIFGCDAFYLKIETNGTLESSRIEIDFDLMMQKERVYASHPAFQNLSLEASSSGGNLRLRRRGIQQHKEVTVSSNRPFKTKLVGFREATFFDWRLLYEPNVKLIFEISKPTQRLVVPLVFSFGNAKHLLQENCFDGSYDLRKDLCEIGEKKCQRIDEICKTNRRSERILFEEFLEDRKQRFFSVEKDISVSRDFLWSKGISGDSPIISFFIASASSSALNACAAFVSAYKKMALTGIADFDLVILQAKSDGYFDPIRDEL